jgi:hypothetical protein
MTGTTPSPVNNVITIDDDRIKTFELQTIYYLGWVAPPSALWIEASASP